LVSSSQDRHSLETCSATLQPVWPRLGSAPVGISRGYMNLMEVWANILPAHFGQVATPQLTPERFAWTAATAPRATGPSLVPLILRSGSLSWMPPELQHQYQGPPRTAAIAIARAFVLDIHCKGFASWKPRLVPILHGGSVLMSSGHVSPFSPLRRMDECYTTAKRKRTAPRPPTCGSPDADRSLRDRLPCNGFLCQSTVRGQCGAGRWSSLWRDSPWKGSCTRLPALRALTSEAPAGGIGPSAPSLFPNPQGSSRIIGVGFRKAPVRLLQGR
jgi:hypothetical protein